MLGESLDLLADVPIARLVLGGHDEDDFRSAEFVVVNPAVRPGHPCLQFAQASGATLTSEIELFLRRCPARVVGVTGSNGKSTTCAMLAAIFATAGRRVWVGGNFGGSLLDDVESMTPDDWVILELSSFQLARLSEGVPLPAIAVVTNCAPNHLDWHGSFAAYRAAKQRLISGQSAAGIAVLNQHDGSLDGWRSVAGGTVRDAWPLERLPPLTIPGQHNRQNAACAAAAASAAEVSNGAVVAALAGFGGLEHRLQFVAEVAGRRYYNDSKSTTPEATLAALAAVDRPVWLLAGGQSKGVTFEPLARAIVARAQGAALFGAARQELHACLQACAPNFNAGVSERLDEALTWCADRAREGDAILLSPACASLDQFRDFTARGEMFCKLVRGLAPRAAR